MKTDCSNPAKDDRSQPRARPVSSLPGRIAGLTETLLVVDDDPKVRNLETQILHLKGYTVLSAQSAAEALRLAAETETIHLLITDFSIPEVDGLELSRRFRVVHPKVPVLMVSGSLPLVRDGARDLDHVELLGKPFAFSELLRRVRTLLDAAEIVPMRKPWCCD